MFSKILLYLEKRVPVFSERKKQARPGRLTEERLVEFRTRLQSREYQIMAIDKISENLASFIANQ